MHLLRDSDAMTITIGSPENLGGSEGRRVLAEFYARLLGMKTFEPYGWLKLAVRPPDADYVAGRTTDGGSKLQLALDGDGWSDLRPPRWPDPAYPQQMHFDILVPDVEAADDLVLDHGASLLKDQGGFRTYADPAGHPFCLYPATSRVDSPRLWRLVLDCDSPQTLADFYQAFLGVEERHEESAECVMIKLADPELPDFAFQQAADFRAARWPDPDYPAQLHVDYRFTDGADKAKARVAQHGARPLHRTVTWADPAGHPFCL